MGDWEWWQVILVIFTLFASMAVFKVGVTFDLRKWLKDRREEKHDLLPLLCPHALLEKTDDGRIVVTSLVVSPPGRYDAFCRRCGAHFIGGLEESRDLMKRWAANPKLLAEREKKFLKQCKRLRIV